MRTSKGSMLGFYGSVFPDIVKQMVVVKNQPARRRGRRSRYLNPTCQRTLFLWLDWHDYLLTGDNAATTYTRAAPANTARARRARLTGPVSELEARAPEVCGTNDENAEKNAHALKSLLGCRSDSHDFGRSLPPLPPPPLFTVAVAALLLLLVLTELTALLRKPAANSASDSGSSSGAGPGSASRPRT